MKKNILRVVALLLIVCVLAGFPLKAKATEVAAYAALSVGAQNLIAGLFNACGLGPGGDPQPFYDAVNQCISDLHLGEIIQGVTWAFSGFQRFAVPVTLAEQVRDWLWDSEVISLELHDSYSVSYYGYTCCYSDVPFGMCYFFSESNYYIMYYSNSPCVINFDSDFDSSYVPYFVRISSSASSLCNGFYFFGSFGSLSDWDNVKSNYNGFPFLGTFSSDELNKYHSNGVSNGAFRYMCLLGLLPSLSSTVIAEGFTAGEIASRYNAITEGYPAWGEGIISVDPSIVDSDETEAIPYIPVGVGQTLEESAALTQEQAQSGVSTIEVSVEIPDDTVAGTKLSAFFSSLLSALSWTSIKTWIEGIWTSVLSIPDAIANLHSLVLSIPQAIADVLADIFIPAEDYISVKVEALAVEYAFVPDIVNSVTLFKNNLVGDGGPPVIYVDFGRAGGSTNYGGKVLLTDFAWYEEYKPTVDALLSAALWAFFLWRVFLKLPGIIGGESAAVGSAFTSYTRRGRDE